MKVHCMRCKTKTDTTNMKRIDNRVVGNCARCGCKKSQFCSQTGGSAVGTFAKKAYRTTSNAQRRVAKKIDKRPIRMLETGEMHVNNPISGYHNFTGPGTRTDLPHVRDHPPYNDIDGCSRVHDLAYGDIFKMPPGSAKKQAIRQADIDAINCYNKYKNQKGYKMAFNGIDKKMKLENKLGSSKGVQKIFGDYVGEPIGR